MSDPSTNPHYWVEEQRRIAAASGAPDPFPHLPQTAPEAALRIDTGGQSFPGGVFIDGVKVK